MQSITSRRPVLATNRGRRSFFGAYFTGDAYTCADAEPPPRALTDGVLSSMVRADGSVPELLDAILMHVVSGAAGDGTERTAARAATLVNALWDEAPALQMSCSALRDAVELVLLLDHVLDALHQLVRRVAHLRDTGES